MGYDFSWVADSCEADELSGTATFVVEGHRVAVHLPSFTDAQILCGLFDAAFSSGKTWARLWIECRLHTLLAEFSGVTREPPAWDGDGGRG